MHIIVVLYKFTRLHSQKGPINLKVVSAGEFMGNGTVVRVAAPHEVQKWKRSVIAEAKLTRHVVVLVGSLAETRSPFGTNLNQLLMSSR